MMWKHALIGLAEKRIFQSRMDLAPCPMKRILTVFCKMKRTIIASHKRRIVQLTIILPGAKRADQKGAIKLQSVDPLPVPALEEEATPPRF